jgi:hypothetical protein
MRVTVEGEASRGFLGVSGGVNHTSALRKMFKVEVLKAKE